MSASLASGQPKTTLRDVFFVLFRQKIKAGLFFFIVVVSVFTASILAPSIYISEAKVLLRIGKESMAVDPSLLGAINPMVSVGQSREAEIQAAIEILTSKELAELIVREFGPENFLTPAGEEAAPVESPQGKAGKKGFFDWLSAKVRGFLKPEAKTLSNKDQKDLEEAAVLAFKHSLVVEVNKQSNIFSIGVESFRPAFAQQVLERLLDLFLDKHIEVYRVSESLGFFQQQAHKLRLLVEENEDKLRRIKMEGGIGDFRDQRFLYMNRVNQIRQQVEDANTALAASEAKVYSLEDMLARLPEKVMMQEVRGVPNPTAERMRERLYELRIQEQRLLNKYRENTQPIQSIRHEISAAKAMLEEEGRTLITETVGVNSVRQDILTQLLREGADRMALAARRDALARDLAAAEEDLRSIIAKESEISKLEREIKLHQSNYFKYADRAEQARINRAMETEKLSNVSIVEAPTSPVDPVRPKRLINVVLGFFLGLFGSVGFAFLMEYLDHTFKKPEEVENLLGIPVFASISDQSRRFLDWKKLIPTWVVESRPIILREGAQGWEIPAPVREQFKTLRDNICAGVLQDRKLRSFAVTSCHLREGVTSVALNLAYILTSGGRDRVLVVDADIRRPYLHSVFSCALSPGLTDMLMGTVTDGVYMSPITNLDFITSGVMGEEMSLLTEAKLYESQHFDNLLDQWQKDYDYVVFDSPSVVLNSSMARLGRLVDGVVWVIEAESVRRQVALYAKDIFEQSRVNVLGCVFNKRRFYVPKWVYKLL